MSQEKTDVRETLQKSFEYDMKTRSEIPDHYLESLFDKKVAIDFGTLPLFGRKPEKPGVPADPPKTDEKPEIEPPAGSTGVLKRKDVKIDPAHILGGYDGGVEVGFKGTWNPSALKSVMAKLAAAKRPGKETPITLADYEFVVKPVGSGGGFAHYDYIIEGQGMKVYFEEKPSDTKYPIKIRYNFEALCANDLFTFHKIIRWFLRDIGFEIAAERLIRVELQVMILRHVSEFLDLIYKDYSVQRADKYCNYGTRRKGNTSYTTGKATQMIVYNKQDELFEKMDPIKIEMMSKYCFGGEEIPENLTRIEFRVKSDMLKSLGIVTVEDLLQRENSLVDWLSSDWFRILAVENTNDGNAHRKEMHPIWLEVRELLLKYFPGPTENARPVRKGKLKTLACKADQLVKQTVGCIASIVALTKGTIKTESEMFTHLFGTLKLYAKEIIDRANSRNVTHQIVRQVEIGDSVDLRRYLALEFESANNHKATFVPLE